MIENLRLENTNSDNSTGALAQGYGTSATYGNFVGLAKPEVPWANNTATANSLYSTEATNSTVNIGTSNASFRFPRYNDQNTMFRTNSSDISNANIYSYGNYYTWAAAVADTSNNTNNNSNMTNSSLCPAGWHLPTGGGAYASDNTGGVNVTGNPNTYREFYNLGYTVMGKDKTAYEDTPSGYNSYYSGNILNGNGDTATKALRRYPNNFVCAGVISNNSVVNRGSNSSYWTSTVHSFNRAYYFNLNTNTVSPGTGSSDLKYNGRSIRCTI